MKFKVIRGEDKQKEQKTMSRNVNVKMNVGKDEVRLKKTHKGCRQTVKSTPVVIFWWADILPNKMGTIGTN